jgi:transglutaminase-like putative cysteine protease
MVCSQANSSENYAEIFSRSSHYHSTFVADKDYTFTRKIDWSTKILDEREIERNKKTSVSYSTSIEEMEIIHAYTMKSDGRKLEVPKNNYQYRSNTGSGGNIPAFSDRSRVTVIFPDLEVGDSTYFAYIIKNKEPMFPGYFTTNATYLIDYAYDDVVVVLDVPEEYPGIYRVRQMDEQIEKSDGRVKYTWRYQNAKPKKQERKNFSIWKREDYPGYEYSTFPSYKAIAESYGKRAKPKSQVTPSVQKLAKKIVGSEVDKREQARLLYNWVATEVSYAGNCIGVGAVVPRDLSFVIENRMGDCKDHATLLEALFATQGIESTQALINSGSIYYLPEIPMVSSVNHVINYLPEFDLYVDATNQNMPFGLIAHSIADKPVLHVDNFKDGLRTPADKPEDTAQEMFTKINIADDGSAKIAMSVTVKGRDAAYARASFRKMTDSDLENIMDRVLKGQGYTGTGTFESDDPSDLADEFSYSMTMDIDRFINRPGAGAFSLYPLAFNYLSVYKFVDTATMDPVKVEINCSNGMSIENYQITIADTMKLLARPSGLKTDEMDIHYQSDYQWQNNVLTVKRSIKDSTKANRCEPDYVNAQQKVTLKILDDLRQQVVYQ